ncbi:MAG: hypothetical protein QNJ92_14515 [Alphaproteobacteria bacterium]|nr:hypothetical protein [Alphaproteobacteria bacterium]
MPILKTEESKRWDALDSAAGQVNDADEFETFIYKIIEVMESNPKEDEDFRATDFMANVGFKFHDIDQAFSKTEQQEELFRRCLRWFALVMVDAAAAGNLLRKIENKQI